MGAESKKKICIAQIGVLPDLESHVGRIKDLIVRHRHADLILFPELILHGHPSKDHPEGLLFRRARVSHRSLSQEIYRFARDREVCILIGEVKKRGDRYYNMATCVGPNGEEQYAKTHVHWTENFQPGKELKVFSCLGFDLGVTICFDAAFSEVFRTLALRGARAIANISAVPETFPVAVMWCRLQAAALNNQVFLLYANRPAPRFSGHSAVFDPRGECLASAGAGEEVLEVDIDLAEIETWREEESIYPHRRPKLYRDMLRG